MRPLTRPRPLGGLAADAQGQLVTEWTLVTAVIVLPMLLLIPAMIRMIDIYFYRIAEVTALPFP